MELSSAAVKRQLGVILSGRVVGLYVNKNDRLGKKDLIAQLALDSKVRSALTDLYGQCAEVCPADKNTFTQFPAVGDIQYVAKYYDQVDESKRAALKGFLDVIVANETFKGQSYSHRRNVSEWAMKYKVKTGPDLKEPKPIRGGQWYQGQPTPSDTHTRHQREKQGDALIPSNLSEEQAKGMLESTAHPDAFMTNDSLPIIPSIHEAMTDFSNAEPTPDMKWKTSMQGHRAETDMKIMKNQPTTRTSGYRAKGQYLPPVPRYATTTETKLSREEAMVAAADSQQSTGRGNVTSEGQQQLNSTTYMTFGQGTGGKAQMGGVPGTNFLKNPIDSKTTTIPSDSKTSKDVHEDTINDADKPMGGITLPAGPTVDSEEAEESDIADQIENYVKSLSDPDEKDSFAVPLLKLVYTPKKEKVKNETKGASLIETQSRAQWLTDFGKRADEGIERWRKNTKNTTNSRNPLEFIKNWVNTKTDAIADAARSAIGLVGHDDDPEKILKVAEDTLKVVDKTLDVIIEKGGKAAEKAKEFKEKLTKPGSDLSGLKEFIAGNVTGKSEGGESLQGRRKMTLQERSTIDKLKNVYGPVFGITKPEEPGEDTVGMTNTLKSLASKYKKDKNLSDEDWQSYNNIISKHPNWAKTFEYLSGQSTSHGTEDTATPAQKQVEQHDTTPHQLRPIPPIDSTLARKKTMHGQSSLNPPSAPTSLVQTGSSTSTPPKGDSKGGAKKPRVTTFIDDAKDNIKKLHKEYRKYDDLITTYNYQILAKKRALAENVKLRMGSTKSSVEEALEGEIKELKKQKKEAEDKNTPGYKQSIRNKILPLLQPFKGQFEALKTIGEKEAAFNEIFEILHEIDPKPEKGSIHSTISDYLNNLWQKGNFEGTGPDVDREEKKGGPPPDTVPASGTPASSSAVAATVATPMDTTDTSNTTPVTVDTSGAGPNFGSDDTTGLDKKHTIKTTGPYSKGGWDTKEEKIPVDIPYRKPPTQPVPFPNLYKPSDKEARGEEIKDINGAVIGYKRGEQGGENQTNTEGDVNGGGRGPDGNLKINRMIENAYVPTLRLFFNEGDANIVNRVNNNPTAVQGSRDVWYDMNSYDWETNNEQDNDLYVMNIVDEARRFSGTLDREELMPKMASEATQESYNCHPKEVFSFPADQTIDAASIMLDVRGGAALTPLTEDQTEDTFHDVYIPDWVSIPNNSPWKRFTQIEGTQMSDSYLRDPSKFSSNDAFFDRNENAFIYTTDM